jgi:hypothetical protein
MGIVRTLASIGTAAFVAAGIASPGFAQENECVRLEARLASLEREGGSGGDLERYESAVTRQRGELDRATGQARAAGCIGGFTIFQSRRNPRCGQIMASIARMRASLNRLSAARDRAGGFGFSTEREHSEILRALSLNRCGPQYADYGRRSFFQTLFGAQRGGWDDGDSFLSGESHIGGTYRTLCVRTCDGYYFPISFATVQSKFAEDEETCRNLCPAAEVSLYIHRSPGEESEAMVSLAGEPYVSLANAFKYRKEYDKACTCGTPVAIARALEAPPDPGMTPVDPASLPRAKPAPLPVARPGSGEDPETVANRAGGFTPGPVEFRESETTRTTEISASGRPVRVVGPSSIVTQ